MTLPFGKPVRGRSRLLSELAEPASAATLAARLGITRQKVDYHLRALEEHRLVRVAEKRQWGGLTERLLVATAASYIVSPSALGPVATDPGRNADRLSAGYLTALATRIVREVKDLLGRSEETEKRLPTLSLDAVIRFRSAADRAAFGNDLAAAVTKLVSRYHDASAPGGRAHRLVAGRSFFRILRLYLTHFRGQHGSIIQLLDVAPEPKSEAWDALAGSLGLAGATVGQRWNTPASVPPLAGLVEQIGAGKYPHMLLLRLDEPTPGIGFFFAHTYGGQVVLEIRFFLYGDRAAAADARDEPLWHAWMNDHFRPAGAASNVA